MGKLTPILGDKVNLDGTETVTIKKDGEETEIELREVLKHCVDLETQNRINDRFILMVKALEKRFEEKK